MKASRRTGIASWLNVRQRAYGCLLERKGGRCTDGRLAIAMNMRLCGLVLRDRLPFQAPTAIRSFLLPHDLFGAIKNILRLLRNTTVSGDC
ncbi:hypothetical protein D9M71_743970 [compost metagenome]